MSSLDYEVLKILNSCDKDLKEKIKETILDSYMKALKEIEESSLTMSLQNEYLRLDSFITSLFFFIFGKLHRGDKHKFFELIEELKTKVKNL